MQMHFLMQEMHLRRLQIRQMGCQGNLQAIPRLVEGMTVEEVERRISGIHCGMKNTSCGDQLAKALREAYDAQKNA